MNHAGGQAKESSCANIKVSICFLDMITFNMFPQYHNFSAVHICKGHTFCATAKCWCWLDICSTIWQHHHMPRILFSIYVLIFWFNSNLILTMNWLSIEVFFLKETLKDRNPAIMKRHIFCIATSTAWCLLSSRARWEQVNIRQHCWQKLLSFYVAKNVDVPNGVFALIEYSVKALF